jgi:CheY-like chemotaxis protein
MDSETLAHATEPFFTTKGVGKGTGLGLSMVHGMAEQVGGRLFLDSKLGEGTTAGILLPAFTGDVSAANNQPAQIEARARPLRVLAVDDDRLVLFNTTAMLEELGHSVAEANSGEEALALLRQQSFDLVIADQAMPKMTGVQLMGAIRELWPGMPMILATGYAEIPGDTQIKLPILNKPFSENELARALEAVAR